MTETTLGEFLDRTREAGRAVGAFTCYDLLGFEALVLAARSYRAQVVILVGLSSFTAEGGERLVPAFGVAAKSSSAEVLVHIENLAFTRAVAFIEAVREVVEAKLSAFGWIRKET